ncbi:RidA family protein [Amycolatopsis regifaucium]|uniref:Enamine deaminase RidA n=1 Tax=Amycolatopsis regifaucium TaxID=546365 RepID=A0A154MQT7_9PSEU|nr:RidA family protein [Amycolatopsis regifaucium]KZB86167.1 enamine deaminase RidA [Amycolatopsis regifaucium]OKA05058.1 enamine deaminase RidA [Amycolatopsis regifaucium]SFH80499.1 Enamine deaminase RidA, house cleaning of reactive enamine intermediates, YjgF/YER057c/UK114 family [Amycolatopsis regifaucium]
MNSRRWNPEEVASPVGRYSHLATVPPECEIVFLSGQLGVLPDGSLAGPDAEVQGRQIFANIEALLTAAGGEPRHLVKLLTLVGGTEHLAGYRTAQAEAFGRWFPEGDFPAQSLAVVAALAAPEYAVEVEAVAAIPRG